MHKNGKTSHERMAETTLLKLALISTIVGLALLLFVL